MNDLLEWCRDQRDRNQAQLERYETGNAHLLVGTPGGHLEDVTETAKADNRRIIAEMNDLIAKIERDDP